jgi:6-phosphogluconate dehydrogenase
VIVRFGVLVCTIGVGTFISAQATRIAAEELLVYGDAELLGIAHPSREGPEVFVTCNGDSIKPVVGEIQETAQRCGNPPLVWFVIANERSRQAVQALKQQDPQAAQQALVQARDSLNQAQELVQDPQTQNFFAEQQQFLQQAEKALEQQDLLSSEQALQEQAQAAQEALEYGAALIE